MKFKIDENLPLKFAEALRNEGHDALIDLEERLGGAADLELSVTCRMEKRTLITLDVDFADIRLCPPAESPGIIVFRVQPQDKNHLLESLHRIVPLLGEESVTNRLWIVEEKQIRIRGE